MTVASLNGSPLLRVVSRKIGTVEIDGVSHEVRAPRLSNMAVIQEAQKRAAREDATPQDQLDAIVALLGAAIPTLGRDAILDLEPDVAGALAAAIVPVLESRAKEREAELRGCPTPAAS